MANEVEAKPEVEHKPFFTPKAEPVVKAEPVTTKDAGLQRIREAINMIKGHGASSIAGSMLSDALILLEEGYGILAAK